MMLQPLILALPTSPIRDCPLHLYVNTGSEDERVDEYLGVIDGWVGEDGVDEDAPADDGDENPERGVAHCRSSEEPSTHKHAAGEHDDEEKGVLEKPVEIHRGMRKHLVKAEAVEHNKEDIPGSGKNCLPLSIALIKNIHKCPLTIVYCCSCSRKRKAFSDYCSAILSVYHKVATNA